MATARGSFPHPVLDFTDDVDASFELFNASVTPTVDDVEVNFQVRMTDPQIQALIDSGAAKYNFRWKCSSTIDGGTLDGAVATPMADSTRYTAWLDQRRIRRIVRVEVTVIAVQEIPHYRLDSQHADYGGAAFLLEPGDVLADAGYFEFEPRKLFDPLNPPVGSCFRFVADESLRKGLRVEFHNDEHVIVAFPPACLAEFGSLAGRPELQISLVVLPALMETITFIRRNDEAGDSGEDLSDRLWATAIRDLVDKVGTMEDSPIILAQRILENPVDRALSVSLQATEDEQ
jgi:hypothetical protein